MTAPYCASMSLGTGKKIGFYVTLILFYVELLQLRANPFKLVLNFFIEMQANMKGFDPICTL